MKAPVLITIVVLTHVLVIGSVLCMQGCRTKSIGAVEPPPSPVLPPRPGAPSAPPPYPAFQPPAPIEPAPAMMPPLEGQTYKVQPGDSLSKIASRAGVTVRELVELNNIKDPNKIRVGQTLVLPDHAKSLPAAKISAAAQPAVTKKPATKAESVKVPEGGTVYVVVAGDSLSKIASKHGVKLADLRAANKLSGDKILIGQKLIIPGKSGAATVAARTEKPTSTKPEPAALPAPSAMPPQPALPAPERIAPAPTPVLPSADMPTARAAVEPQVYRAQENDTVESVAKLFLVDVNELIALNSFSSPQQKLNPGQKVLIPAISQP